MTGLTARLLLGLLVSAAAGLSAAASEVPEPVVVVLSWDGVRHDYPERAALPGLERMERDGLRAGRLIPVRPSNTFPGHVSLATGTYPDRHGIIDNHFIDRQRGVYRYSSDADWIEAEPLWIAAERQGVPAATYFWVGSESDWRGQGTRYRIAPFDGDRPESDKVEQILEWLALPAAERPRLIMSYWAGADSVGHDHGPDSDAVITQLRSQDQRLQDLLAGMDELGLWSYTTLILVSDHGMTEMARYLDLRGALEGAGIDATVIGSAVAQIYLTDPSRTEAAMRVVENLAPLRAYRRADVPEAYRMTHSQRTGDIVAFTEPPYSFSRPPGLAGILRGCLYKLGASFGGHGYDPRHPHMSGVFYALGRGVPDDLSVAELHQVDLAPTVARLLGIQPPQASEGRPVRGIGEVLVGDDAEDDGAN